jgi:CRP/FNR family transcriptional regulator, cyclic AMP receptor protein
MTADATMTLRECAFFEEFQPRHMDKLMTLGSEVRFQKDEIIFREGEESGLFYVILSGRVGLEAGVNGRVFHVQTLFAGEDLGWSAVLGARRQFQARALDPTEAMAFEISRLREACNANPYFGCALLERLFRVAAGRLETTRLELLKTLAALQAPPSRH